MPWAMYEAMRGLSMCHSPDTHGMPMGGPWDAHGRDAHGVPMGCPWATHGLLVRRPRATHGLRMGHPSATHERSTGGPCDDREMAMECLRDAHGILMGCPIRWPCDTHGMPIGSSYKTMG